MKISVVIPTYKRRALLERCLSAVLTQTLDPKEYEVVVSDDAGEPDLDFFVHSIGERFGRTNVKYVGPGATRGPAAARNRGFHIATGEIIAFTDDDCVPSFDWLEEGLRAMESADAVQGKILVPLPLKPKDYEVNVWRMEGAECATANFFCRRSALTAAGGFDEWFTRAWREDSDLYFSLLEGGLRVSRAQQAVVVHPVRPAKWGSGLKLQRNNLYEALLYKKHPKLYRQTIGGAPWDYYFAVAALFAGILGCATDVPGLRWGLAAWALWTGAFCVRRLMQTTKTPAHVLEMLVTSAVIPIISIFWRLRGAAMFGILFF